MNKHLEKLTEMVSELCLQEQRDKCRKAKAEADLAEMQLEYVRKALALGDPMPKINVGGN